MGQRQIWIAAVVAFVLLCTAAVVGTIVRDYLATNDGLVQETRATARLMQAHAEQGIANASSALDRAAELLSATDRAVPGAAETLQVRLDDLVVASSAIGTLWAIDAGGIRWINNNDPRPAPSDLSAEPYFAIHAAGGRGLHVGPTAIGTVRQRPRFTLSRAILGPSDDFRGVVVAGMDVRFFEGIYDRVKTDAGAALLAFNGDGALLAGSGANDPALVEGARRLRPSRPGVLVDGIDGDWLFAAVRLGEAPIDLVAGRSRSAAFADWRSRSIRLGGIGFLMSAGFVLLTVQGLKSVARETAARTELVAANERLEARVKERTATVELLFRELNHRVKNNLQIVASLLRLQLRKTEDKAVKAILQDSINRIFAIADVHGEIENAKNGAISLRSYVGKIVARICDAMQKPDQRIVTRVTVAEADLALDRAVLIAIAINETVTNAFKHAFANRAEGRLDIEVEVVDGRLVLSVRNDADPAASPAAATRGSGLGSSIIGMLVQQMSGRLEIDETEGYGVRIEVPLV